MNKEQRRFKKVMKQRKRQRRVKAQRRIEKLKGMHRGHRVPGSGLVRNMLSFVGRSPAKSASGQGRMDIKVDKPKEHRSIGH